jgi:UDP-GlcNAc:undecaprenyl-phosphate GlcNAc-1-phosphate transferase
MILYQLIFFLILNFLIFKLLLNSNSKWIPVDHPNKKKIHKKQTKLLGGIIFLINLIFYFILKTFSESIIYIKIENIFFILSIFIVSYIDDFGLLKVVERIALYIILLSTFLVLNFDLQIYFVTFKTLGLTFDFQDSSLILTLFCIFYFMNACNLFDGYNLQISNYFIYLVMVFIVFYNLFDLLLFLPFLFYFHFYNKNGKIFMGNSGTFLISFLLGILFIYSYKIKIISVEEIILLMFLPGIDMIRLFIIRILNKKSPFSGDLNHIHHLIFFNLKSKIKFLLIPFLFLWPFLSYKLFNNFMLSIVISLLAYLMLINIKNLVLFFYTK